MIISVEEFINDMQEFVGYNYKISMNDVNDYMTSICGGIIEYAGLNEEIAYIKLLDNKNLEGFTLKYVASIEKRNEYEYKVIYKDATYFIIEIY